VNMQRCGKTQQTQTRCYHRQTRQKYCTLET
jgi:hypothetical protein